jgi:hypothetical protein
VNAIVMALETGVTTANDNKTQLMVDPSIASLSSN